MSTIDDLFKVWHPYLSPNALELTCLETFTAEQQAQIRDRSESRLADYNDDEACTDI